MTREKLLRDPVHDLITFDLDSHGDPVLLRLMDCREFQRLRRIRQLGMAHFAFPGAEHSRFAHSIGVMHLARRIVDRLAPGLDPLLRLATAAAGLLHDLGHGPFSHVIEKYFADHHEAWTARIILSPNTEVHRVLAGVDASLPRLVVDVIEGTIDPPWLAQVVSSQLDADRFDYLQRDSLMTGVKYGVFDLERLIMMLRLTERGDRVFVAHKGLLPVEKYLQSRYQMYRQVYFHKAVASGEAVLIALLDRASERARAGALPGVELGSPLGRILSGQGQSLDLADYLGLDDSLLVGAFHAWSRCDDAVLRDLSERLLFRRLFKAFEIAADDTRDLEVELRIEAARGVLADAGIDPRYYLRFSQSTDTPYRPYSPRASKPGQTIWIEETNASPLLVDITQVSPTIRVFTESGYSIWRAFFPDVVGGKNVRAKVTAALRG